MYRQEHVCVGFFQPTHRQSSSSQRPGTKAGQMELSEKLKPWCLMSPVTLLKITHVSHTSLSGGASHATLCLTQDKAVWMVA